MTVLYAKNLTLAAGNKLICRDLTLRLLPGEIWGLLGPNGCGKTTLLQTLAGVYPCKHGEIWLGEHKLQNLSAKIIAQQVGVLFQDFGETFPQSVFEYCRAARFPHLKYFQREGAFDKHIILEVLQQMELDALMHRMVPHLSGGEKQRLAIASVLIQAPTIYLLDEPTNHLDIRHQINILEHFAKKAQANATVMMVLHDVNLAQKFCDRILLLLPNGQTLQGKTEEIMTTENLTQLYGHPMQRMVSDATTLWCPSVL